MRRILAVLIPAILAVSTFMAWAGTADPTATQALRAFPTASLSQNLDVIRHGHKAPNMTPIRVAATSCGGDGFTCPDGYFCCVNSLVQHYCAPDGGSC